MLERLRRDIFTDQNISRFVEEVNDALAEQRNLREKEAEILSRSLAAASERLSKLYETLETTDVDPKLIAPRLSSVSEEKKELERRLLEAGTLEVPPLDSQKIAKSAASLRELLFEGDMMRRRSFILRFVQRVKIKSGEVSIRYTLPLRGSGAISGGRLGNPLVENRESRSVLTGVKYASPETPKGEPYSELRAGWEDGSTLQHRTVVPNKARF